MSRPISLCRRCLDRFGSPPVRLVRSVLPRERSPVLSRHQGAVRASSPSLSVRNRPAGALDLCSLPSASLPLRPSRSSRSGKPAAGRGVKADQCNIYTPITRLSKAKSFSRTCHAVERSMTKDTVLNEFLWLFLFYTKE